MRLIILFVLVTAGCGQDADILARVSRKVTSKLEVAAQEAANQVAPRLEEERTHETTPSLENRVSNRLQNEQLLANLPIEVRLVSENTVELTGSVADEPQHRRAIELAQNTVGVEKVVDSLTVSEPKP